MRSMTVSLLEPPLLTRRSRHDRILIAGAGGGFDVYAGLPLALALRRAGKQVFLANLTFTYLGETDANYLAPHLAAVTAATTGADRYFPERRLAAWLAEHEQASTIYTFEKVGVAPLRAAYARLVEELAVQAIVLVDGGTDILMRGDEEGLGTPEEDMTSLAAVAKLDAVESFVVSIGFGVDTFHGVSHAHVLENIAAIERDGGYLGAFAVTSAMSEGRAYLSAVSHARGRSPGRTSIVNGSIAAAIEGKFGNAQFSERTSQSELFINPLMSIYFAFELAAVARQVLYLHLLEDTESIVDVGARIRAFRQTVQPRPRVPIPH